MNKQKIAALMTAFSIMLCGCNTTVDTPPPDTSADGGTVSESEAAPQLTESEADTAPDAMTAETSESDTKAAEKTDGAEDTEDTEATKDGETESSDSSDTEAEASETESETEPEPTSASTAPVATEPLAAAETTQAPIVTTKKETVTETVTEPPVTTAVPAEPSPATVLTPVADGILTSGNTLATVDYSHTSDGYVMAKYTGSVGKIKVRITGPTGVSQIYNLSSDGRFESYPLTASDGAYTIDILESVGEGYAFAHTFTFNVTLSSALAPFLRPSQYVNYSYGDSAVTLGSQLCAGTTTALEKVDRIYSWLVDNVIYDYDLASSYIAGGYAGDTEKVVKQKKGICLDYAATMAAMLRSQNVPTQVISGDVNGGGFHAWVKVYVQDVGWVYGGSIYFDGTAWHLMDPTYAAGSHSSRDILDFIANTGNYVQNYVY
ncbi:MAG: transglutaminase-like domain-containing protein [Bacteroides sp.]|nr:transglutaminase-like domain-containing protein [Bacteroides sp.]